MRLGMDPGWPARPKRILPPMRLGSASLLELLELRRAFRPPMPRPSRRARFREAHGQLLRMVRDGPAHVCEQAGIKHSRTSRARHVEEVVWGLGSDSLAAIGPRGYFGEMNASDIKVAAGGLVVSNPGILGGTPVFRGTRLPVQTLFDYLVDGLTLDYFLDSFEGVSREDAQAVLRFGWRQIASEFRS
jgi:uncharacterized protein (DUF433 family)